MNTATEGERQSDSVAVVGIILQCTRRGTSSATARSQEDSYVSGTVPVAARP